MRVALILAAVVILAEGRSARAATADAIASTAEGYLGVPYNWGGTSADGFDCSGFVGKVYAEHGYVLPRVSYQQARVGLIVPEFALQKGDLLFFNSAPERGPISHVGMYLQGDSFIHASVGRNAIGFDTLESRYFHRRFAGARRVLGMPPGRYATLAGTAPAGLLFTDASQQEKFAALSPAERARVVGASPAQGTAPESEHSDQSRPLQIAAEPPISVPMTEVGPTRLVHGTTGVGLQAGYLSIHGDNFVFFQPMAHYVGEATSLNVDLAIPWGVPWDSGATNPMAWGPWDAARTWGRVVRTFAIGQQNANLEARLDRTWSATLGGGQLMRYFTANIGTAGLADAVVEHSALTLAGSTTMADFGAQWVLDDVFSPAVLGARAWLGPARGSVGSQGLWGATRLSLSWAADLFAPSRDPLTQALSSRQVHGFGLTLDIPWYKSARQSLSSMLDASTLLHPGTHGWGMATALTWEARGFGISELRWRLRWEGRTSQGAFIPTYFDVLYAARRSFAPVQASPSGAVQPTRVDWLDGLSGHPWHWSMSGEAHLQMFHRATLGVAYEDGQQLNSVAGVYYPRSLMIFLRVDPISQGASGQTSGLYLAYHLRNADALADAGWRAFLYVAARHDISRHLGVQIALRRGVQAQTLRLETDIAASLSFNFDL